MYATGNDKDASGQAMHMTGSVHIWYKERKK